MHKSTATAILVSMYSTSHSTLSHVGSASSCPFLQLAADPCACSLGSERSTIPVPMEGKAAEPLVALRAIALHEREVHAPWRRRRRCRCGYRSLDGSDLGS